MTPFAIAGIQMPITTNNNIAAIRHRVELLMHLYPWVQMVILSELAVFGPLLPNAQKLPGPAEDELCEIAAKHGIWFIPGSLFERSEDLIYNTSPVINPAGEVIARYRKMFPFRPFEIGVTEGSEFVVFDVPDAGRFGVSICYDIWFPETSRMLASMGAEVILHPVLTHTIDRDVDIIMARASAASCQCYVFDINGLHAGGNGQSAVFDPSGRALHQSSTHEELIPIEIDFDQVRRQRERGLRGLGQPLKSFRDSAIDFSIYDHNRRDVSYLNTLGPLVKPEQAATPIVDPAVEVVATAPEQAEVLSEQAVTPQHETQNVVEVTAIVTDQASHNTMPNSIHS